MPGLSELNLPRIGVLREQPRSRRFTSYIARFGPSIAYAMRN